MLLYPLFETTSGLSKSSPKASMFFILIENTLSLPSFKITYGFIGSKPKHPNDSTTNPRTRTSCGALIQDHIQTHRITLISPYGSTSIKNTLSKLLIKTHIVKESQMIFLIFFSKIFYQELFPVKLIYKIICRHVFLSQFLDSKFIVYKYNPMSHLNKLYLNVFEL